MRTSRSLELDPLVLSGVSSPEFVKVLSWISLLIVVVITCVLAAENRTSRNKYC